MNSDYIPLDQAVIDRKVEKLANERIKAREILRGALKNAGGNIDIVVFPSKFKRIIKALACLNLDWFEIDGGFYVNRHELDEVITDRSGN